MKRTLLLIGILCTVLPHTVAAQCPPTGRAADLLDKTPIGEYTKLVKERTDDGITYAKTFTGSTGVATLFGLDMLIDLQSIFYMLVDTDLRSVEYSRDLTQISACLHADLAILEAQIENVRCEINAAYDANQPGVIRRLKSIAGFLNQRYKHLVEGALNAEHIDKSWSSYDIFDEPFQGWCCVLGTDDTCSIQTADTCRGEGDTFFTTRNSCLTDSACTKADNGTTNPPYENICPFDSNYLAYNTSGYGCSAALIADFANGTSALQKEAEAAEILENRRDALVDDMLFLKDTSLSIDDLVEQTLFSELQRDQLDHFGETRTDLIEPKHVFGCNADMPPDEDTLPPSREWSAIPLRGPFFFTKDHIGIWNRFLKVTTEWETKREMADSMKNAEEFPGEADRERVFEQDWESLGLLYTLRGYVRSALQQFQITQAVQDAAVLPKVQDMALQVRDALQPVRSGMNHIVSLVSTAEGPLRQFGIEYTYYLRRTCIDRPCNERLETILKVLLTDECFPYASGEFQPDADDPSWQKCQDAVDDL